MSPQDKVERVLKEIHVTFSKSPSYNGRPDKLIIDRKHFLSLLDRLNQGIFDMMEQYEQTRQSRMMAERAFQKKSDEIIENANASAEDIYAASVIYTADAIARVRDLMDLTNESMNDLFRQFRKELREQKDLLKNHESDLQAQLTDLADTQKYLALLKEVNLERERQQRSVLAEKELGNQYRQTTIRPVSGHTPKKESESGAEKPEIKVNTDAAYFKWKEGQGEGKAPEDVQKETDVKENEASSKEEKLPKDTDQQEKVTDEKVIDQESDESQDSQEVQETPAEEGSEKGQFPDEEAIRQAVLEDERQMEFQNGPDRRKEMPSAGHILKTLLFGKDE